MPESGGLRLSGVNQVMIRWKSSNCEITFDEFCDILGQSASIDTGDFAITRNLQTVLGDGGWIRFINTAVDAFMVLRTSQKKLIQFGKCKV